MPDAEAARLPAMIGRVGKQVAGERQQPRLVAQPALAFVKAVAEIFIHHRVLLRRTAGTRSRRHQHAVHAVALREADPDMLALVVFVITPAGRATLRRLGPMPIMSTERCDGLW